MQNLVPKLLTTLAENHKESKETIHLKLIKYTMQRNSIQNNIWKLFDVYIQQITNTVTFDSD